MTKCLYRVVVCLFCFLGRVKGEGGGAARAEDEKRYAAVLPMKCLCVGALPCMHAYPAFGSILQIKKENTL